MKKYIQFVPLLLLTSCATIMHGTRQNVGISSNPSAANVWINRQLIGQTPLNVGLARKQNHLIQIELEGYKPYEIILTNQASAWVFGNIIFGGVIGLVVDLATGGIYKLTPDQVTADLLPCNVTCSTQEGNSCIAVVLEPKAEWEKIGQLERV